jgi:hypothetical protein
MNVADFWYVEEAKDGEIRQILAHILDCYKLMVSEKRKLENKENYIRNVLIKDYLRNGTVKKQLQIQDYRFLPEAPVINESYEEIGRTDIEVILRANFDDDNAVYRIECKRLDSKSELNKYYVEGGIMRYIEGKYATFFGANGMLAFCVSPFNIDDNILKINKYINRLCVSNTHEQLTKNVFLDETSHSYVSKHSLQSDTNSRFSLYHLMLDFSDMI